MNTGNVSLNNIVITDVMPDGSTGVLGLHKWITCYRWSAQCSWDLDILHQLYSHSERWWCWIVIGQSRNRKQREDPDPKMDEESTPVSQQPSLWSDKSSSFDFGVNLISNLVEKYHPPYTYHVTNNGRVTQPSNVSINESSGQFTGGGVLRFQYTSLLQW